MSERGSFVTEYVYCKDCFAAARKHLLKREKHHMAIVLPSWVGFGEQLPIIAGKVGGLYQGGELHYFEQIAEELAKDLCHQMRIAVLAEEGERIFVVPAEKVR